MSLTYTESNIAAGNLIFGVTSDKTLSIWGMTFVEEDRFILVLARVSDGTMEWRKIDPLTLTTVGYAMPYAPSVIGVDPGDRTSTKQGQYLDSNGDYLYYLNGNTLYRCDYATGVAAGYHVLRDTSNSPLTGSLIDGFVYRGPGKPLYVYSSTTQKIYRYNHSALVWNDTPISANVQVTETTLSSLQAKGAFIQPETEDFVLLVAGGPSRFAVKYTEDLVTRKGITEYSFTSNSVCCVDFRNTLLHFLASDNTVAGGGIYIYRYGDASTGVVSTDNTSIGVDTDRVKAGSGTVVKVTYSARDGYGEKFQPTEYVRFNVMKVGDAYDGNDGALAATNDPETFRDSQGNPINPTLDVPFDVNGNAVCYWHTPLTVPTDLLLHRIRAKYPINL